MLLRWIAQHRSAPVHLRTRLISRLPWRALASIAWDSSAHPQARAQSVERLQTLWTGLTIGERRSFAAIAPRQMWPMVWKVKDVDVISAFLRHPKLGLEMLASLVLPPISQAHLEALQKSSLSDYAPIIKQVIMAIDQSLQLPGHGLALGVAVTWLQKLDGSDLLQIYHMLNHPLLKGMAEKAIITSH
jgi:hypothetical protein